MSTYFANKFKELRIKNNLTQEYIANKYNMSKSGISYWESGRNEPSIERIDNCIKYHENKKENKKRSMCSLTLPHPRYLQSNLTKKLT